MCLLRLRPALTRWWRAATLLATITQLVDALTGLERILTTPIPFSYSIHLWSVTLVYLLVLVRCVLLTLRAIADARAALPALEHAQVDHNPGHHHCRARFPIHILPMRRSHPHPQAFIFLGFLVAGEEIENPFGYDKNDLNMDHFTHEIIREELRAITAAPAPDPSLWAFASSNDAVFDNERTTPEEWVARGKGRMLASLGHNAPHYS
jgi:putative membrane protein